jgi:hypothetical protein
MPISKRALSLSGYFEYKETEPSITLPPCENVKMANLQQPNLHLKHIAMYFM